MAPPALLDLSNRPETARQQLSTAVFFAAAQNSRLRKRLSGVICLAASATWIVALSQKGDAAALAPWYLTIAVMSSLGLWRSANSGEQLQLPGAPKSKEPVSFLETYSLTYLAAALVIFWFSCVKLVAPSKPEHIIQVVDIQLESSADYEKQEDSLLPSTKPQEALRKRLADTRTVQGSLTSQAPSVPVPRSQSLNRPKDTSDRPPKASESQGTTPSPLTGDAQVEAPKPQPEPINLPKTWATQTFAAPSGMAKMQQKQSPPQPDSYIWEAEPPELVELVENEGDADALQIFQRGGKSQGGKGQNNPLANYLKRLHHRIKTAWTPPKGQTRRVELQFRLTRAGKLAQVQVLASSGQNDTDASTLAAVTRATDKPEALPADYPAAYLDIVYTFKYNVDELQEVQARTVSPSQPQLQTVSATKGSN